MAYADRFTRTYKAPDSKQAETKQSSSVATPSLAYQKARSWWDTIDVVKAGTWKLRELGEAYLPKEPQEGDDAYKRRLSRVTFAPWYVRLRRGVTAVILRKPIALNGDRKQIEGHLEDINLQGDNLQTFSKDVLEAAIDYGFAAILVDYPDTSGIQSRADERRLGVRPYWSLYPAPRIIGMKFQQQGSQRTLTQVRLKQTVVEDDGDFGEAEVEQVLVYDRTTVEENGEIRSRVIWRIFREDEEKGWYVHKDGQISLNEIPIAVVFTDKNQRLDAEPPMLEIAYLNLQHYQLSADLDHSLHIASVPRLFLYGTTPEEIGDIGTIDEAICISSPEARAEWSVATIAAFQPLSERIDTIESQMTILGLQTLATPKNVGESAEAKRLDRVQSDSIMAVAAQFLQNALNSALYFHSAFLGENKAPTCQVSRDFELATLDPTMLSTLFQIRQGDGLSQETFLRLLQQGEIMPDDWTPEGEMKKLQAEFEKQAATQPTSIDELLGNSQA